MAPRDGWVIPLEVADCSSVHLAICQENIPMGTAPQHRAPSLCSEPGVTPALPTSLGCTEEAVGTGRSQTRGQPRVILHWEPQQQAPLHTCHPPLPWSLEEPTLPQTLTNHQGCGLEIGIEGTTALPIFQEDAPRPILCQREVLHILQGSRRVGSGARQGMSGLSGKGGGCQRRQLYRVEEEIPRPVLPTPGPGAQCRHRLAVTSAVGTSSPSWQREDEA